MKSLSLPMLAPAIPEKSSRLRDLRAFFRNDAGSGTVEFVVVAACTAALGLLTAQMVERGATDTAMATNAAMQGVSEIHRSAAPPPSPLAN